MSTSSAPDGRGQVVTFYSFKGGVGRTMALANVAWILASRGKRVLAVDWDLEAPGLHSYFHPLLTDPELRDTDGLIDLLRAYQQAVLLPGREDVPQDDGWFRRTLDLTPYVVGLDLKFASGGRLDFLPAGRQNAAYSDSVTSFDWHAFYGRLGGGKFLLEMREEMAARYDYVLIDSRTGVTDSSGICTVLLPDTLVLGFVYNVQNMRGSAHVARAVTKGSRRPIRLLPVPMRVEDAERERLEISRDRAREAFGTHLPWLDEGSVERYWGDVEIPYKTFYAYEEIVAPVGDRPLQEGTVLKACERLTDWLTDGEVRRGVPLPDEERQRLLTAYMNKSRAISTCLFVSYAPEDRIWAEWAAWHLESAGFRVTLHDVTATRPGETAPEVVRALAEEGRVLALLSAEYAAVPQSAALWRALTGRERAPAPELVAVRVHGGERALDPPFDLAAAPSIAHLTEVNAVRRLRQSVGPPPSAPTPARGAPALLTPQPPRYPGTNPAVESLQPRNVGFTGRNALLHELRDRFIAAEGSSTPQVLVGLGGVGKTQTALEYTYRFRGSYDVVWWVPAAEPTVIPGELARLAPQLGIEHGEDTALTAQRVLRALASGTPYRKWLLVLDSAGSPGETAEWLPAETSQGGHVLVTSRDRTWEEAGNVLPVEVFSRSESVALLGRHNPGLDPDSTRQIAHELGDLPLAVHQAAVWLSATAMPVDRYLQLLRTHATELLKRTEKRSLEMAGWLVSLEEIRANSPAAADLLEICSFFGADPIPMELLYTRSLMDALTLDEDEPRDEVTISEVFQEINRFGLAQADPEEGTIVVHRLVQAEIRHSMPVERRLQLRSVVHAALAAGNPKTPGAPESWPRYAQLLTHLWPSRAARSDNPEVQQWIIDTVRCLWRRNLLSSGRDTAERVLTVWTERLGPDNAQVLGLRTQLGNILRSQGVSREAYDNDLDVHRRLAALVGPGRRRTLIAAANVAADLNALGRYARAREWDRATYEASKEVWPPEDLRLSMHASNLGVSEYLCGDRRAALEIHRRVYRDRLDLKGPTDIYTLNAASNYARDLRETGDLRAALDLLEETCQVLWERLGKRHAQTLSTQRNHAVALRRAGRYEEARELVASVHLMYAEDRGRDHPDTLAARADLANVLAALGDVDSARDHADHILARQRQTLGESHPYTLGCQNNLAIYLRLGGHAAAARATSERSLRALSDTLGERHPYTLDAMINYANCLVDTGGTEAAIALEREALAGVLETLGADHYDVITLRFNLSIDLAGAGATEESEEHYSGALQLAAQTLGVAHPTYKAVDTPVDSRVRLDADIEPPFTF
ncbi:FxSxx-COOH system tetratricopeptide repeat protein [Streptomyces europaeiscabiei]|uniref:FxSxx-COOH system tetratricopeptide repeat protein n=1 Tax=Streptomyces europaeiscabiei TaxID=146819 RepID=UPI0029A7155E|nr:FxSxx-COOH system tetratricopeptide repeat protein [Streptomyces europaeiscabiei]MDX2528085.1 FxSxx-COOH system tetratricopeptide repeat protein [Streptomyces europaeiscabiei]